MYDLIIIGGGPAGLSAALSAKRHSLKYLVIEKGVIANTVYNYPIARKLFSSPDEVELEPHALPLDRKPTREQTLAHYIDVATREQLYINTSEQVGRISAIEGGFSVKTNKGHYGTRTLLMAVGGFGRQRKLNVPGESESRVSYRFSEAHPYAFKNVLIIGGGNSAAEAAIFLVESGAKVTLSLRRASLDAEVDNDSVGALNHRASAKIKPWVREPLDRAASEGKLNVITSSEILDILPDSALLRLRQEARYLSEEIIEVPCDHIFALIGADPDTHLLEQAGAEIAPDGRPVYDPITHETTVPGLYVAGHLTRELHMKKAIEDGRQVVDYIASSVSDSSNRVLLAT
jgi:thioredoxin reductase (NADPH)